MEKKSKAPLVYGYAVCIVAVITFLISIAGIIFAVMDLGDPLYAGRNYNKVSLASFENYKMDMLKSPDEKQAWVPDDETLKAMYEAEKDDVIRRVKHNSMRSLYINGVLIIICIVLFLTHWRWMRRVGRKYNTA
ncbi:MAG: hypothetical protein KAH26_00985 [Bacteroidales bacterium]|nr:hypothetical protein [Bacteroidales bacterium]